MPYFSANVCKTLGCHIYDERRTMLIRAVYGGGDFFTSLVVSCKQKTRFYRFLCFKHDKLNKIRSTTGYNLLTGTNTFTFALLALGFHGFSGSRTAVNIINERLYLKRFI